MKAKVLATGEIIDVEKIMDSMYHDVNTSGTDEKTYYESDLELLPDTEEETMEIWVARDKGKPRDLSLHIYPACPQRWESKKQWVSWSGKSFLIDHRLFSEVTWDSEPKRVKITITPIH